MQGIDSRRYLGNSDESTMHTRKPQWVAPLTALLLTTFMLTLGASLYRDITTTDSLFNYDQKKILMGIGLMS